MKNKMITLVSFLLLTLFISCGNQQIYGKWISDEGDTYEFKVNSFLYNGYDYPASYEWENNKPVIRVKRVSNREKDVYTYDFTEDGVNLMNSDDGTIFLTKYTADIKIKTTPQLPVLDMVEIPGLNIKMLTTEVTQDLYKQVMGINPSFFQPNSVAYKEKYGKDYEISAGEDVAKLPVDSVSMYDAVAFCNKLSVMSGLIPVYVINGSKNPDDWNYKPNESPTSKNRCDYKEYIGNHTKVNYIEVRINDNGYRLPKLNEMTEAAQSGRYPYTYSGSNDINRVAWWLENSGEKTHAVGMKKATAYGLYDLSGNVGEWCFDYDTNSEVSTTYYYYLILGGNISSYDYNCAIDYQEQINTYHAGYYAPWFQKEVTGFRIVCPIETQIEAISK